MIIHNGDHAQFELDNADTPPEERSDWPLPSFSAEDWARAFCKRHPYMDEGIMTTWFANALMRGYDEGTMRMSRHWLFRLGRPIIRLVTRWEEWKWQLSRKFLRLKALLEKKQQNAA